MERERVVLRKIPAVPPKLRHLASILIVSGSVLAVFGVAAALRNLEFSPGLNFDPQANFEGTPAGAIWKFPEELLQIFLVIGAVLLVLSTIILIRSKTYRKRAAKSLALIAAYLLIFLLFASRYLPQEREQEPPVTTEEAPYDLPAGPGSEGTPPAPIEFEPPQVAGWIGYAVTLGVLLLGGGFGYYIWKKNQTPKLELREITRAALADLDSGRTWDDVVIQCYAQMSTAVNRTGHLYRPPAMTPAEFSRRLEMSGLPVQPVRSLTRLFEVARYGSRGSTVTEAASAKACLTAILETLERRQ